MAWRGALVVLLVPLLGCAGGKQYSIATNRPLATQGQVVLSVSGDAQNGTPDGHGNPGGALPAIFVSQQLVTLGPGQFYLFGGTSGSLVLSTNVSIAQPIGLVNALVPTGRTVLSLGNAAVLVRGNDSGQSTTVTTGTTTTGVTTDVSTGLVTPIAATTGSLPGTVSSVNALLNNAATAIMSGNVAGGINSVVAAGPVAQVHLPKL